MPQTALKDMVREIRSSKGRFIAIMVLVALAVAFLSGLKATAPSMKGTGDSYLDDRRLMDIQIISSLGLTDEDIAALEALSSIQYATGAYVIDAWVGDSVAKLYSLTDEVNLPVLLEGRLPEATHEVALDRELMRELGLKLGEKLRIEPGSDYEDALIHEEFVICGTVRSPYYISVERGSASIGSGSVQGYAFVLPDAFDMEAYTTAFLLADGALELMAFTDEYDDYVESVIDSMEQMGDERAELRYDSIIDEAREKIDDAQLELDEASAEAQEDISEGERKLRDARLELDDGWKEYEDGRRELDEAYPELLDGEKELYDGYVELINGEREYAQGVSEYNDGYAEYLDGKKQLDESGAVLSQARTELENAVAPLNLSWKFTEAEASGAIAGALGAIDAGIAEAATTRTELETRRAEAETGKAAAQQQLAQLPDPEGADAETAAALAAAIAQAEAAITSLTQGIAECDGAVAELEQQRSGLAGIDAAELAAASTELQAGFAEFEKGEAEMNKAKRQLDDAQIELVNAQCKLREGWAEYYDGRRELDDGWREYEDGRRELPKALKELEDGEAEYAEGLEELEEGKQEFEQEIADAEEELADARREVADIEAGEWYILPRGYNPGYTGFGQDADRMANLAAVFPIIFFLVAALVCLTTMTRMVEEHRTEIGLMKALGYGRWTISSKYLSYGLLPGIAGSVIGLLIGHTVFPAMIYISYQIMYETPGIELSFYPGMSLGASGAAIACTTLSTLWACLSTLEDSPANLMRPRAPKPGRRVLLERITPIWHAMSFNWKITTRNLLRYQKRFWMTVVGIGGCTGLIIAGFGLRGSLTASMTRQYDELFKYDAQLTLAEGILDSEWDELSAQLGSSADITAYAPIYATNVTAEGGGYSTTAYLEVFDPAAIHDFMVLRSSEEKQPLQLTDEGVLIDQKLSELLGLTAGDSFTIDSDGLHTVTVAGVYEHYVGHFIYMTPEYYRQSFEEEPELNSVMLNLADRSPENCERVVTELLRLNGVSAATRAVDTRDTYLTSMERVDFVVVVVILCAAALAIVVLYNLSNINMAERIRELATIKVLGFQDAEVTAYICRESAILTIFGILMGGLFGRYLHAYLIRSVEIDLMMFGRETTWECYVFAALLTLIFSAVVNVMAHRKMKEIDMVESLKSAE